MSEPLRIYRHGERIEQPDPSTIAAAERALAAERRNGQRLIEFCPPLGGVFFVANPDFRTYP